MRSHVKSLQYPVEVKADNENSSPKWLELSKCQSPKKCQPKTCSGYNFPTSFNKASFSKHIYKTNSRSNQEENSRIVEQNNDTEAICLLIMVLFLNPADKIVFATIITNPVIGSRNTFPDESTKSTP